MKLQLDNGVYFSSKYLGIGEENSFLTINDKRITIEKYYLFKGRLHFSQHMFEYKAGKNAYTDKHFRFILKQDGYYLNNAPITEDGLLAPEAFESFERMHEGYHRLSVQKKLNVCRNQHYLYEAIEEAKEKITDKNKYWQEVDLIDKALSTVEFRARVKALVEAVQ